MIASVSICSLKSSPINLMFPMERLRALSFASFSSSCSLSRSLAWKWEWEEDKSEMIAVSAAVKSASFCLWRIEAPRQQMEIIFTSPYSNFILSSVFISLIKLIQFNCKKKCNCNLGFVLYLWIELWFNGNDMTFSSVLDLVQFIGCWLDEGRSKCELAVDCQKRVVFKQTKWLEKSGIHHQTDVVMWWNTKTKMKVFIILKLKLRFRQSHLGSSARYTVYSVMSSGDQSNQS